MAWQAAFLPGSDDVTFSEATVPSEEKMAGIYAGLLLVEKFLCMINQPGLVDQRARDTDKRVIRLAAQRGVEAPESKWHQCHIRPGVHGSSPKGSNPEHRERQLHYVRKHLKPSLGPDRWIEGHWRGNVDLGIHLKSYVGHPPKSGGA